MCESKSEWHLSHYSNITVKDYYDINCVSDIN